jgi:integrase
MTAEALFYLRLIFNQAEHLELILRNPAKRVRVAKPPGAMSYAETSDHPLRAYLHLALTTGMRHEELLGLAWARVDLEGTYLDMREVCTYKAE